MGTLGYLFSLAQSIPPGLNSTESDYWPAVEGEGSAIGVDPALIMAVIRVESNFRPMATHTDKDGKESYGLMQMRLATARQVSGDAQLQPDALFDPTISIQLGAIYLGEQLNRYGGNVPDAVAAYNAGSVIRTAGGYANQGYVDKVLAAYASYQALTVPPDAGYTDLETMRATRHILNTLPVEAAGSLSSPWVLGVALGLLALLVGMMGRARR